MNDHPANAAARARRAALPPHNDFDIVALATLPPYWGWVEAQAAPRIAFRMFLGGNDDGVALRLFWNGGYEPKTLALWSRLARNARLALDIGAHTGVYTLAARAANPGIDVLSFEPHAMNYARLLLNLRANGFETRDAYMIGVGAMDAMRPFTVRTQAEYLSTGGAFDAVGGGVTNDLRTVALDSFLPDAVAGAVGLIKLDVEGYEAACLSGMGRLIERARPSIVFECTHETSARALERTLGGLGYRFFDIDDGDETARETTTLRPVLNADGSPVMARLNRIAAANDDDIAATLNG